MFSWQGLLLMFMFGVLVTMTTMTIWLMYSELRLIKAEKQLENERDEEMRRAIRKKLLDEDE